MKQKQLLISHYALNAPFLLSWNSTPRNTTLGCIDWLGVWFGYKWAKCLRYYWIFLIVVNAICELMLMNIPHNRESYMWILLYWWMILIEMIICNACTWVLSWSMVECTTNTLRRERKDLFKIYQLYTIMLIDFAHVSYCIYKYFYRNSLYLVNESLMGF